MFGVMFFFVAEKIVRVLSGGEQPGPTTPPHSPARGSSSSDRVLTRSARKRLNAQGDVPDSASQPHKRLDPEDQTICWSTAVLNLCADALHNFTDGLALGVSWNA